MSVWRIRNGACGRLTIGPCRSPQARLDDQRAATGKAMRVDLEAPDAAHHRTAAATA
jgi:hypothetical protein